MPFGAWGFKSPLGHGEKGPLTCMDRSGPFVMCPNWSNACLTALAVQPVSQRWAQPDLSVVA